MGILDELLDSMGNRQAGTHLRNIGRITPNPATPVFSGLTQAARLLSGNRQPERNATIGGSVTRGKSLARPQPQQAPDTGTEPLGDLYGFLLEMLTQDASPDEGQIRGQVDPIYDQRVAAIQQAMEQAEHRTNRGREDIEGSYRALSEDYERLAPEARQQSEDYRAEIENLYGQLKANTEGHYSRISDEQTELFKRLGIEEAAPDVLNPQAERAASGSDFAERMSAVNQQRAMDIGNTDETYFRQGAPLANLTGANRSADLLDQLQQLQMQGQQDISAAEAERSAALNQLLAQQQSQGMQQEQQQAQMLWQILQQQMQGQQQEMTPEGYLSSLPGPVRSEVAEAYRSLERSPEAIWGRQELEGHPVPGTYVPITDEWWLSQADKMYEEGEISEAARQYLIQFLRMRASS